MPRRKAQTIARQNQNPQMLAQQRTKEHNSAHEREREWPREIERVSVRVSEQADGQTSNRPADRELQASETPEPHAAQAPSLPQATSSVNDIRKRGSVDIWQRACLHVPRELYGGSTTAPRELYGFLVYRFPTWSNAEHIKRECYDVCVQHINL